MQIAKSLWPDHSNQCLCPHTNEKKGFGCLATVQKVVTLLKRGIVVHVNCVWFMNRIVISKDRFCLMYAQTAWTFQDKTVNILSLPFNLGSI